MTRWFALALAACSSAAPAPSAPAAPPRPAWEARAPGGARPIDPGPAAPSLLDAKGCATCHAAIAAEWATSRHALAWTNGIFQREFSQRPQAWCVNCHAPLTTQQAGAFRDAGVDCAGCHVRDGRLVSARVRPGSPHRTVADPTFGSPAYCADCHQFDFPILGDGGAVVRFTSHPMQTTVASFRAGPYAAQADGCMTCHGSKANHAFGGAHDPGMLGGALDVAWCRRGDTVEVTVKNAAAGHTVPSGDVHRHLNVRLWRSSAPEALVDIFLGRRFEEAPDGGKTTTWDSTLAPGESRMYPIELARLAGDASEPVNLELEYVYIANEFPRPREAPDEPTATSVFRRRAEPEAITPCPSP